MLYIIADSNYPDYSFLVMVNPYFEKVSRTSLLVSSESTRPARDFIASSISLIAVRKRSCKSSGREEMSIFSESGSS